LGFHARHQYEESALSISEAKLQASQGLAQGFSVSKLKLKNEDAVTAVACASFGLDISFRRVLKEDCCGDETWVLETLPSKKDLALPVTHHPT